jgi:hypothetical protein
MKRFCLFLTGLVILGGGGLLSAQELMPGERVNGYMEAAGGQAVLFYGREQEPYAVVTSNHPYFREEHYGRGRLSYRGAMYPEVLLRMDLYRGELIVLSPAAHHVRLTPTEIDFAELHGRRIVYLSEDTLSGSFPAPGLYFLLYDGDCRVFEKQTATLQRRAYMQTMEHYFAFSSVYYLWKEGVCYRIKSRNALLKALGAHRKELERHIRANKLDFRKDAGKMIVSTVETFEKIAHP